MARIAAYPLRRHWPLLLALGIGLALRVALWGNLPRLGLIGDEAEYLAAADWLAAGRGFAWHTQYLWTRAPLYPLFLAGHVALFGREPAPIFLSQSLLSLLNVALVYALGLRLTASARAAGLAAALAALYLPLAVYAQLLLSETLFITLLLAAFVAIGAAGATAERGARVQLSALALRALPAVASFQLSLALWAAAGALLGLATLTRGLTLGFLPIVALWAWWSSGRRIGPAATLLLAAGLLVAPWSLYASRAYGGRIIVDTTGAYNLALGARTAFDGGRSDEPTRNFVLALLDPALSQEQRVALVAERRDAEGRLVRGAACLYAAGDARFLAALERPVAEIRQGERQALLAAEARCLLQQAPVAFVAKSLAELVDLFKINYTGAERLSQGFALGRLPQWYVAALYLLDDLLYVIALPLAVLGWAALRQEDKGTGGQGDKGTRGQGEKEAPADRLSALSLSKRPPPPLPPSPRPLVLLVGLWLLYNLAAAPLLFAINRFRVPLMPFALILAAYALVSLPALGGLLRTRYGAACAALAGLLLLIAAAPHAYLEPRAPGADSRWASLLGPYPSSLENSRRALAARPGYLAEQELAAALGAGDVGAAGTALAAPALPSYSFAVGAPLLDGLAGRPADGLDRLAQLTRAGAGPLEPWQTAVVAGELFRQLGDLDAARRELNPELVDRENPVAWAWQWLAPPRLPADRIALADDNDLGYIRGFFLGEFDQAQGATVRWATGEAALRFPGAGTGAPRTLCLRLAAPWPADLAPPAVTLLLDGEQLGRIATGPALEEACVALPARPPGAAYQIELRAPSFVPDALDLLKQQGPLVGQLRQLAVQIDWAEVR